MLTQALGQSLVTIMQPELLYMLFLGTIFGLCFGSLPGLSAVTGMALVLPFTFGMNPQAAMLIYAGIVSVSPLGGSLAAILLNTPGTPQNIVSTFDGFPLTQQGKGTRAITISSASCFLGSVIGVIILLALIKIIRPIILIFRAPEIFWLIIFGLTAISIAVKESAIKGLAAGGIGILLSLIGWNDVFAGTRFTGGSLYLWDGIPLIPLFIGLLAISELIFYTLRGGRIAPLEQQKGFRKWNKILSGIWCVIRRPFLVVGSSIIGTTAGIVPGVGGAVASFMSYSAAKRFSKSPALFGKGSEEGLIAAEVANDAKEGGSLLPTVAFGIPGSPDMAVVLGAFILHGLEPGPLLLRDHLDIVLILALGIVCSQLIGSVIVLFVAPYLVKLVTLRVVYISPIVLVLCLSGAYSIRLSIFDVFLTLFAGFFGFFLRRYGYPIMPIAIGFMLGNLAEKCFHQALMMSYGSYNVFFSSSICITLIAMCLALLFVPHLASWLKRKQGWV